MDEEIEGRLRAYRALAVKLLRRDAALRAGAVELIDALKTGIAAEDDRAERDIMAHSLRELRMLLDFVGRGEGRDP